MKPLALALALPWVLAASPARADDPPLEKAAEGLYEFTTGLRGVILPHPPVLHPTTDYPFRAPFGGQLPVTPQAFVGWSMLDLRFYLGGGWFFGLPNGVLSAPLTTAGFSTSDGTQISYSATYYGIEFGTLGRYAMRGNWLFSASVQPGLNIFSATGAATGMGQSRPLDVDTQVTFVARLDLSACHFAGGAKSTDLGYVICAYAAPSTGPSADATSLSFGLRVGFGGAM